MKRSILFLLMAATLGAWAGCDKSQSRAAAPAPETDVGFDEPRSAQPRLPTIKLWVGAEELVAEIAKTSRQMQTGMMFRKQMGENEAMIFVFSAPERVSFYMKNTTVPLSAAYADAKGTIREIHDLKPLDLSSVESATSDIQYVIEVPQGWFQRHQVKEGMVFRTEKGSLKDSFFGRKSFSPQIRVNPAK